MGEIFGDFDETITGDQEHLTIVFSPSSIPLKERWRNNSLSADFMADYFANFFPGPDSATAETSTRAEVKGAISYIANELLENAVKFHHSPGHNVSITLQLESNELVFLATNSLNPETVAEFKQLIQKLLSGDPGELYLAQLEKNALDEHSSGSGLGLLTMLHDYGAQVGWKFHVIPVEPEVITVTTMVKVVIQAATK